MSGHYAVWQVGGQVWGIGETEKEAREDYSGLSEEYGELEEIVDYCHGHTAHDEIVCTRCSKALYDKVNEDGGGVGYEYKDGQLELTG